MAQRLPTVGSDSATWGTVMNGYLGVGHNADGTHHWYDVREYGAVGNGTTDDTAAIQAAMDAAGAAGGVAWLPGGTYKTTAALVINHDNVTVQGSGWQTVIQGASGSNHDLITTPIPAASGTAGFARFRVQVRDLQLDGSLQTGTTAGQGNGLHFYGARYCQIEHVFVYHTANWAILLDGDGSPNFSYNNKISRCRIDGKNAATGTAGIWCNSSEANEIVQNDILGICTATTALQPAFNTPTTQTTNAYSIWAQSGFMLIQGNMVGESGAYTTECMRFDSPGGSRIIGNRFDTCNYQAIKTNAGHQQIIGNDFDMCSSVGTVSVIEFGDTDGANVVQGNCFHASNNTPHYQYCVREIIGGAPGKPNEIIGNTVLNPGTQNNGFIILTATSTSRASGNSGYNPVQSLATPPAPSVAASGSGSTIAAGTYQVEVTLVTASGETAGSAATSVTPTAGQNIVITAPAPAGNAVGWYAYVTQSGGAANTATRQQTAGAPTAFGANLTLTAPPTNTGAVVSASNTTADVTTPSVPATTVAQKNTAGVDVTVYLTGGTVTAVTIGNKATGLTSGTFRLPAGQTITLTYSVAPTWVWVGE